ncbi:hypothetical protein R3P38DRAFT_3172203 [Favolaschia claudopus]|uniref:Uncharacterized protein n=1 Tax=Favolaschia claudopus TaxID=2862362 RepID=A0AAW0DKM0_9AGAR
MHHSPRSLARARQLHISIRIRNDDLRIQTSAPRTRTSMATKRAASMTRSPRDHPRPATRQFDIRNTVPGHCGTTAFEQTKHDENRAIPTRSLSNPIRRLHRQALADDIVGVDMCLSELGSKLQKLQGVSPPSTLLTDGLVVCSLCPATRCCNASLGLPPPPGAALLYRRQRAQRRTSSLPWLAKYIEQGEKRNTPPSTSRSSIQARLPESSPTHAASHHSPHP